MGDPKSNNSQHGLSAQAAADLVRGSYAVLWANAHTGTEIRGGYARESADAGTETAGDGESSEDI